MGKRRPRQQDTGTHAATPAAASDGADAQDAGGTAQDSLAAECQRRFPNQPLVSAFVLALRKKRGSYPGKWPGQWLEESRGEISECDLVELCAVETDDILRAATMDDLKDVLRDNVPKTKEHALARLMWGCLERVIKEFDARESAHQGNDPDPPVEGISVQADKAALLSKPPSSLKEKDMGPDKAIDNQEAKVFSSKVFVQAREKFALQQVQDKNKDAMYLAWLLDYDSLWFYSPYAVRKLPQAARYTRSMPPVEEDKQSESDQVKANKEHEVNCSMKLSVALNTYLGRLGRVEHKNTTYVFAAVHQPPTRSKYDSSDGKDAKDAPGDVLVYLSPVWPDETVHDIDPRQRLGVFPVLLIECGSATKENDSQIQVLAYRQLITNRSQVGLPTFVATLDDTKKDVAEFNIYGCISASNAAAEGQTRRVRLNKDPLAIRPDKSSLDVATWIHAVCSVAAETKFPIHDKEGSYKDDLIEGTDLWGDELKRFSLRPPELANSNTTWELSGPKEKKVMLKVLDYTNKVHVDDKQRRHTGKEALEVLQSDGLPYLPNLQFYSSPVGLFQAVRYDKIAGGHEPKRASDFMPLFRDLKALHDKSMVHGDVRLYNIVFPKDDGHHSAKLIDFDFAGPAKERYPDGYTGKDLIIERHEAAQSNAEKLPAHDMRALCNILQFCRYMPEDSIPDEVGHAMQAAEDGNIDPILSMLDDGRELAFPDEGDVASNLTLWEEAKGQKAMKEVHTGSPKRC